MGGWENEERVIKRLLLASCSQILVLGLMRLHHAHRKTKAKLLLIWIEIVSEKKSWDIMVFMFFPFKWAGNWTMSKPEVGHQTLLYLQVLWIENWTTRGQMDAAWFLWMRCRLLEGYLWAGEMKGNEILNVFIGTLIPYLVHNTSPKVQQYKVDCN